MVLPLAALLSGGATSAPQAPAPLPQELVYQYIPFDQLDPQRVSDGEDIAGQNLLEGLVTPDVAGTGVVPATADRWTASKDGRIYTFHIRSGARWSDGTPVTARDFEWSYRRLLTPSTSALDRLNGSSSYQDDLGIENAVDFQLGKVTAWSGVGVKALDDSHLRIVLDEPNAYFLREMAHPSMVALPEKNVKRFPYSWQTPAHWVGNGPFVMTSWTPGTRMVLAPNEQYWDRKNVHLERVDIVLAPATPDQELARYRSGDLDIVKLGDPAPFQQSPALSRAITRLRGYSVGFLTLIPSQNPVLEDVRVREAIALGLGRAAVAKANPLMEPATSLVPRALPGFDGSVGFREDVARARRLLADAGFPGGEGFPTLSVMTSYDDPLVRAVLPTLKRNLGITAMQDVEAPAVASAREHEVQRPGFVGFFSTGYTGVLTWRFWVSGTLPPSQTELLSLRPDDYTQYEVLQADGTPKALAAATDFLAAHASPQSRRFAAVAAEADATADPRRAIALYKQAAAIRQSTYEFIPYAYKSLIYAIRPDIKGVHLWTGYFTISFKGVSID